MDDTESLKIYIFKKSCNSLPFRNLQKKMMKPFQQQSILLRNFPLSDPTRFSVVGFFLAFFIHLIPHAKIIVQNSTKQAKKTALMPLYNEPFSKAKPHEITGNTGCIHIL